MSSNPEQLDLVDQRLIEAFQKKFPLVEKPFALIARQLGTYEEDILLRYQRLLNEGFISRIGPVFNPKKMGASTLAAIACKTSKIEENAAIINGFIEVNHNYLREHNYNLWFVVTANNEQKLKRVISRIEKQTGCEVLSLPMQRNFHIDLGFNLWPSQTN